MDKLKKVLKFRSLIFLVVVFVLSITSMFNFSVALYANNKEEVSIDLKKGDIINKIVVSKNNLNLREFESSDILLEKINNNIDNGQESLEENYRLNVIKDTTIRLNISVIDDLDIVLNTRTDREDTLNVTRSKFDILHNSLNSNSIIIFIASFAIFCVIVYLFNYTLKRISEDKIRIWNIALFLVLIFCIYLSNIYLFMTLNRLFAIIPAFIISVYVLLYFKFSIKEWKNIFLFISAIIGTMMIFVITPGNVPDEPSHYFRSYVDSVSLDKEWKDNAKVPESINKLIYKFTYDVHSLKIKYSGRSYMTELLGNNDYSTLCTNTLSYDNTKNLSFLPYLPSTVVNFICRNLRLSVLITFLLCRLMNLIISTTLCYFAIKHTPKFKKIFALIAMLPIFMQQAAGVDMDYMTNSVVFLFIAVILKYRFEDTKLDVKKLIYIFALGIILGLCKFGYFPLLFLIFMIPNKNISNKKLAVSFKVSLILIPIIVSYLANFSDVTNPNTNTEEMYTIKTVLSDPINSAKICIKTFIARFASDSFSGLINNFGWSTKHQLELPLWTLSAVYILCLFTDNEDSKDLKKKDRIIMLGVCAFIYLILYGVAFTEWTSILSDEIRGLQSRYFIPILPLLYISISNTFFSLNVKDKWRLYTILIFIAQILSTASILTSFY